MILHKTHMYCCEISEDFERDPWISRWAQRFNHVSHHALVNVVENIMLLGNNVRVASASAPS